MTIQFLGATGEVTGSLFLIETNSTKFLVDCGLFQGVNFAEEQNYQPFAFDPHSIDALLITHAHLDHCGRIPKLWQKGFRGPIYCTPATGDLVALILADAASVMLHDAEDSNRKPLYYQVDVANAMSLMRPVEYGEATTIAPGIEATFFDAGHILGSSTVSLTIGDKTIVFSGDIGNHPVPILRHPEVPERADALVMEATYGGRRHDDSRVRRRKLRGVITRAITSKGTLLIPAFALERTQELLYELHELIDEKAIPPVPIYLDSPLAIAASGIYPHYERYFDEAAKKLDHGRYGLFHFPALRMTQNVNESKAIWRDEGPKIIIAGSGMMEGGRIVHHARHYLPEPSTTLLMVGYQATGTLGRQLFDGRRRVKIMGEWVSVKAKVVVIEGYSAHADQDDLKHWLEQFRQRPEDIYLVHSEPESATAFRRFLGEAYQVSIPKRNEKVVV